MRRFFTIILVTFYGSIDGLIANPLATYGYADAFLFGSL
jgi:hypothetical protein